MSTTLYGRPTKGRRPLCRLSFHASNTPALARLSVQHNRIRTEIAVALMLVGLNHLDELGPATLNWARQEVEMPAIVAKIDVDDDEAPEAEPLYNLRGRIPELHHNVVEEYQGGAPLRSALAWIGLHHVDELGQALGEVDDLQRRLPTGQTLGDFYSDTISELCGDNPPTAGDALHAIRQLRAGESVASVAKATGLNRKLLTALSVEAVSAIDGGLPLTG